MFIINNSHSSSYIGFENKHPGVITLLVIFPTTLLIVYSKSNDEIFNNKILAFIGKISFSNIYMALSFFFSFARHTNFFNICLKSFYFVFLPNFSAISYFLYEKKLRDKKKKK